MRFFVFISGSDLCLSPHRGGAWCDLGRLKCRAGVYLPPRAREAAAANRYRLV